MHHRGDAAYPTTVGCRDPTGGVGVNAQHSDHLAQGENKHSKKQYSGHITNCEKSDASHKQHKPNDRLGDLRQLF